MAIPELLIGTLFQSTCQVAELVGGTSITQIGADVYTGAFDTIDANKKHVGARVIEYRGEIWTTEYDSGPFLRVWGYNGTSWSLRHSNSGATRTIGMWIVNTGSAQRLVVVGTDQSANVRVSYTDDGSSWTDFSVSATGWSVGNGPTGKSILFNNKIYINYASGATPYCIEVDPVAETVSNITPGWPTFSVSSTDSGCFVVYDDRLFCAHQAFDGNPAPFNLYEFTGGGWSTNVTIDSLNLGLGVPERGCAAAFTDPSTGDLIVLVNGANTSAQLGSHCYRLTPSGLSFTVTDITSTVIPSGFRPGDRATNDAVEDRWFAFVSTDNPASPEIYPFLAQGPAPGTGYAVYQWQGVGSVMTSVGSGPSTVYAIPEAVFGGGDRISRGPGSQCVIESAQAVLGGYEISYRVYGTQTGQNVTLWYSTEQEVPDQQATISAQTGGSGITGGNTVTGIDGDDGTTLYTLTWDIDADGVTSGDASHMLLDIQAP